MNRIFALYDENTIRVYQAYSDAIANEAIKLGTFGNYFKMNRMTWIKPSFLWMMYRSGWATKEGQNRILAIDIKRSGFDYIVNNAVLSSFSDEIYDTYELWKRALEKSEVRCQWDPERDIYGNPQNQRTIQLGIKGRIVKNYVDDWIVNITDITRETIALRESIMQKRFVESMLPVEKEYFVQ
ncbi:MAG: DUF4291 domain-containing protein [Lachnoclostridium sp.]|jgi:hypothetical protein|nr:DUF4291 domain-containing protein [Lachnoclostridium sp.]